MITAIGGEAYSTGGKVTQALTLILSDDAQDRRESEGEDAKLHDGGWNYTKRRESEG